MLEHIAPQMLIKSFIIAAFAGAIITSLNLYRSRAFPMEIFGGFIWGAAVGTIALGTLIAIVESIVFLFT